MSREFDNSLMAIMSDRSSGSAAILDRFIDAAFDYIEQAHDDREQGRRLREATMALGQAFPLFAVVAHFAEGLYQTIGSGDVITYLKDYGKQWNGVSLRVAQTVISTVPLENRTVLFHSNSSTLSAIAQEAMQRNIRFRIIQTESQPGGEGADHARQLARSGADITLVPDAAVGRELERADLAMVGTDWMTSQGFINKVGTKTIAALCHFYGKPFYVAADSRKLRPGMPAVISEQFEVTGMGLVTMVIGEGN